MKFRDIDYNLDFYDTVEFQTLRNRYSRICSALVGKRVAYTQYIRNNNLVELAQDLSAHLDGEFVILTGDLPMLQLPDVDFRAYRRQYRRFARYYEKAAKMGRGIVAAEEALEDFEAENRTFLEYYELAEILRSCEILADLATKGRFRVV